MANNRLEGLLRISQYQATDIQDLLDYSLHEAILLTESSIGYIYFYDEEKQEFELNSWSNNVLPSCKVMNPHSVYQLEKTGCWGEAVRQRGPVMINDFKADNPMKKGLPEGHVALKRFLTIPVIVNDKIVAVVGVANKSDEYDKFDIRQLTILMDFVWKKTELINMIENLKLAKNKAEESDRLKSAFLANMSHEIRTPMNAVLGFTQLLKAGGYDKEETDNFLDIINLNGQNLLSIINDIIDLSKIESGLFKISNSKFDVNPLMQNLHGLFYVLAKDKGLDLEYVPDENYANLKIELDDVRLTQILTNFIGNALKFTHKGSVRFGYRIINEAKSIQFFVRDTGIGITAEHQTKIFDRFVQADNSLHRKYGGTGLGLAISKSLTELMGGTITLVSEVEKGSEFSVILPLVIVENYIVEKETKAHTYNWSNKTILVVDDTASALVFLKSILTVTKANVVTAKNGQEAIDAVELNKNIDIILMDVEMPIMNGYNATKSIKSAYNIPIIIQSAHVLKEYVEKANEAGADDIISKPIDYKELFEKIDRLLK